MNILLSGGTGFLGSSLARHWASAGHSVTVLMRSSSSTKRIESLLPRLTLARVDAGRSLADIARATEPHAVVHTACAYGRSGESALELFRTNVGFGMELLQAAVENADSPVTFLNTGTVLESSVSTYALAKNQFVEWGERVAREHESSLRFINVRLQHMYGAHDDASKFTTRVLHSCFHNEKELELTAGEQRRDMIYIDDVVSAFDVLLRNAPVFVAAETIDLGSGEAPTIRCFVERVHTLCRSRTHLKFGALPYRANEAMLCLADTRRLRAMGWKPEFTLDEGIRRTIELEFHQ